jgi:hypothetical protein
MVKPKESREFNIRKFDMKKLKKESIIVLLGKRNTGKSFLIKDILYHMRMIKIGMVISRTDHLQHYYDKFIPSMLIYKQYTPEILDNLFKRQEKALEEGWENPNAFLLMDDCLSDREFAKDPRINAIFFEGRHSKILYILAMQVPLGIGPNLRTNIDFTFILRNSNNSDREKIYKNYAGMFSSREEFEIILDNCTEDYNCLVIDNTTQSNKLEDQVFYYKAESHEDFKMCSNTLWQISNENFKNNLRNNESCEDRKIVPIKNGKAQMIINKKR